MTGVYGTSSPVVDTRLTAGMVATGCGSGVSVRIGVAQQELAVEGVQLDRTDRLAYLPKHAQTSCGRC
jgi:hypothetical protein